MSIPQYPDIRVTTVQELIDALSTLPRSMSVRGERTVAVGVFVYGGTNCPQECKIQDWDDSASSPNTAEHRTEDRR